MAKRRKLQHGPRAKQPKPAHKGGPRAAAPQASGSVAARNKAKPPGTASQQPKKQQQQQQQHQRPVIPFSPDDAILLVGEGDLSFARSLIEHHACADLTATVLEKDLDELVAKYPQAADNVAAVEASGPRNRVLFGVDARKMGPFVDKSRKSSSSSSSDSHSVAAAGAKDRILFNFPHVGGKSTDVNRQVRYNQELLVDFFGRAERSLAPGGSIVVTLFEGEPYTLWNVRDLARHSGLQVERSFAFRADAYPGYHHARTLGAVRGKDGELGGGWKGEERAARSYVFYRKGEVPKPVSAKKRRRSSESSSGSEVEESDGED